MNTISEELIYLNVIHKISNCKIPEYICEWYPPLHLINSEIVSFSNEPHMVRGSGNWQGYSKHLPRVFWLTLSDLKYWNT